MANVGTYDAAGTKFDGLKKFNFSFGFNGSGKTTISRVVEGSGTFPDCQIHWTDSGPLESRVYNRDFVTKHVDAESSIKGIYNPIKSSYELLWREVRQKPPSDTAIQNVTRRILEHDFKFYGGLTPETRIDSFEGKDKMVCNSLLSWINDGSHFAPDDLYVACDLGQIDRYLAVFQWTLEESGHGGHYKMMMGDDDVPFPLEIAGDVEEQALIVQEADGV